MNFGENLKNIRKERGVTQEKLAEILGVSRYGPVIIGLN